MSYDHDNHSDSPVYDDNPRLSNTENDFEDLTHSEAIEQMPESFSDFHDDSPDVLQECSAPLQANHVAPDLIEDDAVSLEQYKESSAPPQAYAPEDRGDVYSAETRKRTYSDEEDDDVKAASEASELLKQHMPPRVRDLVYWNCPLTTGALLGSILLFEFSLLFFSVISVLAYTGLAIMIVSLSLKLYVHFIASGGSNTIHRYIEADWNLSPERTEQISRDILKKMNNYAVYTRDLFLINNYGESIKFAIFLYFLTYIGAWFNFLTLVILGTIFTFSIPKVYDIYKREIDHVISLGRRQFKEKWIVVRGKIEELPVVGQKLKRN